jgi:hypothetical protein
MALYNHSILSAVNCTTTRPYNSKYFYPSISPLYQLQSADTSIADTNTGSYNDNLALPSTQLQSADTSMADTNTGPYNDNLALPSTQLQSADTYMADTKTGPYNDILISLSATRLCLVWDF